jgi:hypothetical protein
VVPFGSSPVVDPLYSSERIEICHDLLVLTRTGKVACLADQRPDLLPYLRVCFAGDHIENCGRCGKCLLTMASLVAAGALEQATGFPSHIDLELLRSMSVVPLQARMHWVAAIRALPVEGEAGRVREAMVAALRRSARPGPAARASAWAGWLLRRRASPRPSWREPDRGFDWRYAANVLRLLEEGKPWPPLRPEREPPLVRSKLRPPP